MTAEPLKAKPRGVLFRRVLMNLYVALTGAYGLNVTLLLLVRAAVGERWSIIGFFNSYLHLLILPAVVLLPLSLLLRRRWLVIELAAPFLFFVASYGAQFAPRRDSVTEGTRQLAVMSFNLLGSNLQTTAVIQAVRESAADLVALQELTYWMAEAIEEELAAVYPYRALYPQNDFSGQGLLSRYPITAESYWQIHLGQQAVEIDWNGQPITVFNAHPSHPLRGFRYDAEARAEAIDDVLRRAASSSGPVVLIGDFNMTNLSDDYARVTARYADAYAQVGWGLGHTYPNMAVLNPRFRFLPALARIDYVFHDAHFKALSMTVGRNASGSDHFPIYATLAWVRPS